MSEMNSQLNELNAVLEAKNKQTSSGPILETTDQSDLAKLFLTDKALEALSKKATSIITYNDYKVGYICIYLGVTVKTANIPKGVEVISESLNRLADQDLIHSTLAPPSSIKLARVFGQADASIVYSFVLVPIDRKKECEDLALYALQEGEMGKVIEDLSVELGAGEFLFNASVIHGFTYSGTVKGRVNEMVNELLSVLPKGTELVSITPCAITGLNFDHEVRLRNPLMNDYKEVKLHHVRQMVKIDDKHEQFSLLREIDYIKKDSNPV